MLRVTGRRYLRYISKTNGASRQVQLEPYRMFPRNFATSTSEAKSFLQRELKLLTGIAITGGIGGCVYYYAYRKRLPNQVYELIESAQKARNQSDPTLAISLLCKAKDIVKENDFSENSNEFIDLSLGQCYNQIGDFRLAKKSLISALLSFRSGKSPDVSRRKRMILCALNELAQACDRLGETDLVERYYLEALEGVISAREMTKLYQGGVEADFKHVAPFALEVAVTLNNLGAHYVKEGRLEAAKNVYMRCLAVLMYFGFEQSTHAQSCSEILETL